MVRRVIFLFSVALIASQVEALAQQMSDDYYRENPSWLDAQVWANDGEYQLLATKVEAPFEHFALYGFSFVEYDFRAENNNSLTTRLGAIDLDNPLSRYADWGLINLLRRVPAERTIQWSNAPLQWGPDVRSELFDTSPHRLHNSHKAELRTATRTYRLGVGYSTVGSINDSWRYSLAAGGRWGRDGNIEGLFDQEEYLWLSGERGWEAKNGSDQRLQLALMVAPTLRSQRSWNTEEVFSLAGNKYYNSYWGYQEGKVRSQRVRRECVPTLYASWNIDDRYILSNLNISTLLRAGRRSRSTLDWGEAPSPLPDYRGYLPSGCGNSEVALQAEEVWREGNTRYTQIDWEGLYRANSLSLDNAQYALLDQREDLLSGVVNISAGLLGAEGGRMGVKLATHTTHNYNTSPRDLLGAVALGKGFDLYDYNLTHSEVGLYGSWHHIWNDSFISLAAEAGGERIHYAAKHNKRKAHLTTPFFRSRATMMGPFSEYRTLGGSLRFDLTPPYWGDRLGAHEGAIVENPYATIVKSAEGTLWTRWDFGRVDLHLSYYLRSEDGLSTVEHFWNDVSGQYSALLAGEMWYLTSGVEASLSVRPTEGLSITAHSSIVAMYPLECGRADIVAVDSGSTTATNIFLNVGNFSSSPRFTSALVVRYSTPRGWLIGAEWAYVALRNIPHSLLLTSDYILARNLTPEERELCTQTHQLGRAHNVGLFAWRRFGAVTLSLSVRNLLNFTNAYSAGYQPSRIAIADKEYAMGHTPHAPKYQYIYPRHAYLTIAYEF